jgi:glycosyltransferase involved in cell wall biosynthesis
MGAPESEQDEPVGPVTEPSIIDNRDGGRELKLLSVVVPMYDEEATVDAFHARLRSALEGLPYEVIVVDDGSTDRTPELLDALADTDPRVRVVHLSRNFGHQMALTAGFDHAHGDAVVTLDGDLQDPPEEILTMLEEWRTGSDVVYAVRERREGETTFKLTTARWFYNLFGKLAGIDLEPESGDYRLLDRRAVDALLAMRERNRFLRGMTVWVGFRQSAVSYERDARYAGETKYTLRRMIRFAFDAITSFSDAPLKAATLLGFVFSGLALLCIPVAIGFRISDQFVPGVATTVIAVLLLGGVQLITIGIIGEYVGRIYDEVKRRPLYIVSGRRNLPEVAPVDDLERERISSW